MQKEGEEEKKVGFGGRFAEALQAKVEKTVKNQEMADLLAKEP